MFENFLPITVVCLRHLIKKSGVRGRLSKSNIKALVSSPSQAALEAIIIGQFLPLGVEAE